MHSGAWLIVSIFNVEVACDFIVFLLNKGNNKITELQTIFQRESKNS